MIIERNYEGAYVVSDIVNGFRVCRKYYGYTRCEALAMFKREVRALVSANR